MADFRLGRLKFNWRGAWAASTAYVIDDIISFKGNTYVCVVNHTSASNESNWATTDLNIATPRWQLHVPGVRMMGAWTTNAFYAVNDVVSYGANQFLCISNHTSAANENLFYANDGYLSNSPKWSLFTEGTRYVADWTSGTWYKLNDIVKYGNTLYLTTVGHTSGIQFDPTKYSVYIESVNFEDSWGVSTEYQPGDIVTFGGYTYIAETINTGKQPNIFNVDDNNAVPPIPRDWSIITTGFDVKGEYDNAVIYVPGDVVKFGGNTYVKIATGAAGVYPTDVTAWQVVSTGLNWRGPWNASNTYQINDVVSKQSASWVNLTAHNINIDPVADGGTNWQAVAQGESVLTLQDPGDILYRNSAGANVNLPIGANGEILTVDAQGLPAWERNNICANVYYIATDGVDDPAYGSNISKPWASIGYALTQIPAGSASSVNTIFVKSGTYEEQLPLTIPEYTCIVGDSQRATVIKPDPNTQSTDTLSVENRFSTMFYVSESTILRDLVMIGMEGFEPASGVDSSDVTQSTVRGVFLRLNPASPIVGKSPYITQCSAFSGRPAGTAANCTGGVGAIIDKSIYGATTANGSILFDSFTQIHDLGVGFWCKDLGNAEIVSSFTYYAHIGYSCTGGGRIRSLSGNNSWGNFGCVSSGFDTSETALTANIRGQRLNIIYDEASASFAQNEEVVQGAANAVNTFTPSSGTQLSGEANNTYSDVNATGGSASTPATFDISRDANGDVSSVSVNQKSTGYVAGEQLTIVGSLIGGVDSTDDIIVTIDTVATDYSDKNTYYARALVLYVQVDYLIIEPITGNFTTSKPIIGDGSASVAASGATGATAAGGATPALEGIKGKIFPLTNLPVVSGSAQLPQLTGATKFLNVAGNSLYDDNGYYVIKEVVDASTSNNLFLSTLRQFDVPGTAPTALDIGAISRTTNVATVTCQVNHGLTTGDEVTIVISNTSPQIKPYATGYDANDGLTLGIRNDVLQRTVVTVTSGTEFTYANSGNNGTISAGDSLLTGSKVYLQGTSGGSTKALHLGGSSVTLYNTSTSSGLINATGVNGINSSATTVPFADESAGLLGGNGGEIVAGANNFLMINNELMNITSVDSVQAEVTVTRGDEGTTAAAHADGSIIYFVQKAVNATTLRGDVDTAVTDIPLFSISSFDKHDVIKVDNEFFKTTAVNSPLVGKATIIFAQPKQINAADAQSIAIRLRYSQVRLTGHDFLQIGTGSKATTNWPDQPIQQADQQNEVIEDFPGRVYYVSTDQDGNFRVGEFFTVEQATGTATLDASAFNLSGLASLRLGTLGAELGVAINEFSSDPNLGGEFARDGAVPSQLAVKTYVDSQSGSGIGRVTPTVSVVSPDGLTSIGTTATIASNGANNVYIGDSIIVSGATDANYNGEFVVVSIDLSANTFSYTMNGTAVSPASGSIAVERKQRVSTDLEVEGLFEVNPTWNTNSSTDALVIDATNTLSGAGTSLIKARVDGTDKFTLDKDGNLTFTGSINGDLTITGDLTVSGNQTTINTTVLTVEDINIVLGATGSATDSTANGGGITLSGSTNKTFNWINTTDSWTSSEHINLANTKTYKINGAEVLSGTALGSSVTGSSLTTLGTITNGIWQGTAIEATSGGTGQTSFTKGDLLIATDASTLTKVVVGADGEVLTADSTAGAGVIWAAAAAGGGASYTVEPTILDRQGFNLNDEGKYLDVTNMDSYFHTFRIRGMDTATKAYMGTNCMVQNGSGGNMQHLCSLFSVNQTTGAIQKEQTTVMHNNTGSTSDYSTVTKTGDEWTGRYTYHGHIPCNGTSHTYSYHQCYIYNTGGSKDSNHTTRSTYYPAGNDHTHNHYVAPGERRLGGAVRHFLAAYDGSSRGCPLEFYYDYHASSLNASRTDNKGYSTSATSTTYQVTQFQQWDSTNEPYYDAFMMQYEGLHCHERVNDSWTNKGTSYGWSSEAYCFTLSNGNMLYGLGSTCWLIDGSGNFSAVAPNDIGAPMSLTRKSWAHFCYNVGQDEWLLSIPGSRFMKFKINPTNGHVTISNMLTSSSMEMLTFDESFQKNYGFYGENGSSVTNGGYMTTFGDENSNGYGYGQSKLVHIAGNYSPRQIQLATWDISTLLAELTYA